MIWNSKVNLTPTIHKHFSWSDLALNHLLRQSPNVYRPSVDGLRAVSVIAVIINHLNPDWIPYGYLGVDVFFVISGFVVTLSLLHKPQTNFKEFILGFYSRRVRRLYPALIVVVFISSLLALFVMHPGSQERLTSMKTGMFSLAGLSNLFLLTQRTDYFGISAQMNLFLHTWSLGVEEQFYIIFPLLWFLLRRSRIALVLIVSLLGVASCWFQHALLEQHWGFGFAFYLMPARFWELAAGVILAFLSRQVWALMHSGLKNVMANYISILSLLYLFYIFNNGSGVGKLGGVPLAVVMTVLLLFTLEGAGWLRRMLSLAPLVAVGVRSYGLYLWHWPLIVLMRWIFDINIYTSLVLVGLTISLSWLMYAKIEIPLRRHRWRPHPAGELALGSLCMGMTTLFLGTTALTGRKAISSYSPPAAFPHLAYAPEIAGTSINRERCFKRFSFTSNVDLSVDDLRNCSITPKKSEAPTLFLVGDSFAAHLSPIVSRLREEQGIGVEVLLRAQCPFPSRRSDPDDDCTRFENVRFKRLASASQPGDVVLLATSSREPGGEYSEHFLHRLTQITDELTSKGVRVIFQSPIPLFTRRFNPVCRYPLRWFQWDAEKRCSLPNRQMRQVAENRINPLLVQLVPLQDRGLELWDVFSLLCAPTVDECQTHRNGIRLYRDHAHLSAKGAEFLYPSFLHVWNDDAKRR